nr:aldehyde ferredoxin oxidoreductase family protein [Desulforamulus hydrothermalis]
MKGFYGKLLRIDLTNRLYQAESIPEEVLAQYLGGKGLGSYLLWQENVAKADPLGPGNKLIFALGPATGSGFFGVGRFGVFARSPLTGGFGESYCGGKAAEAMKAAGYDAVIVEGCADRPVYLEISDRGVAFREAAHLWGLDTIKTEETILKEVNRPGAQAVVIGPAGEQQVAFACLESSFWRSAGRGGMGAVLGSKKVKGIVFYGTARSPVADEAGLQELLTGLARSAQGQPGVKFYRTYGTPGMVALLNKAGAFPSRYWSAGELPEWEQISGERLLEHYHVQPRACCRCLLACGKLVTVKTGLRRGLQLEGPEYETIYAFGGLCCITDMDEIIYLNHLCDRLGMDTITAGNLVALAMEATARGKGNLDIAYGDAAATARLLEQTARREGAGAVLADGIIPAAERLGMTEEAVHVKGMEPAGYDPRILKGVGLGYATSARGACHLRATFYKPELSGVINPDTVEGKPELYIEYENRLTVFNTLILCVFFRDLVQWEQLQELLRVLTGYSYEVGDLRQTANRIITLNRMFNLRCGFDRRHDTLPDKIFKQPLAGRGISRDELAGMVQRYYQLRGWDDKGIPGELSSAVYQT